MKIKPVIMAGGRGTRLWPLSRQSYPKQFVKLVDNLSLMQSTIINNSAFGKPTLVIIKEHEEIVKEQLKELGVKADLIIEPIGQNTAPCAIISAMAAKRAGYEIVILLPCDHYIDKIDQYLNTIEKCLKYVAKFGICTIGVKPNRPDTEYGYIAVNKWLDEGIYHANNFIEKPHLLQAQIYLQNEKYFWNTGIFIFKVDFILEQAQLWQKKLYIHCYNALYRARIEEILLCYDFAARSDGAKTIDNRRALSNGPCKFRSERYRVIRPALKPYLRIKSISLDYAIMSNINQMIMVRGDFSWYDLGNWYRLWQMQHKDILNNYCEGDVIQHNRLSY